MKKTLLRFFIRTAPAKRFTGAVYDVILFELQYVSGKAQRITIPPLASASS